MGKDKYNITINRLYGSGGRIMGKKLSEELGIPFYDEEILKMASEASAVGEQYFRLNDEKAGNNLFFRAVGGLKTSLEEPSLDDDITSPENLFRFQSKMIRQVAREQSCIIMGRCADFVLEAAGFKNLVRMFVYADSSTCIRRVCEVDGVAAPNRISRILSFSRSMSRLSHSSWDAVSGSLLQVTAPSGFFSSIYSSLEHPVEITGKLHSSNT